MKTLQCVIVVVFVLFASAVARKTIPIPGGWSPIKNISDPHVKEIAAYAVQEYDKRSGQKLKLEKVVEGDTQVVEGINYRLILAATNGSSSKKYEAIVWEKVWQHFRNLTSFTPVHA